MREYEEIENSILVKYSQPKYIISTTALECQYV